jgi:WD40 repeat protein
VLVTASEDGSVRVWDLKHQYEQSGRGFKRNDRNCVIEIGSNFAVFEHRNSNGSGVPLKITAIDVCPLGAYVATGTADGVVRVFRYLSPDPAFPSGGRFVLDATQFDPLAVSRAVVWCFRLCGAPFVCCLAIRSDTCVC